MSCKIRIKNLEQKVGQKAPPVIIAFTYEEAKQKRLQFEEKHPLAPQPVILIPARIDKKIKV